MIFLKNLNIFIFYYQATDLLSSSETPTKPDITRAEEKEEAIKEEKKSGQLKSSDEEEEEDSRSSQAVLVIKNAWKDLPESAAFPAQLNMDECPPLRGYEGTGRYRNCQLIFGSKKRP